MKTFPSRTSLFCLFLALCLAAAESSAAQNYKAEALSEPPPSELAAPVRNAVSATGIRVTGPSGALCDIWLGKAVRGKANAPQSLGVVFPQFGQGTLVAGIRLSRSLKDYHRQLF